MKLVIKLLLSFFVVTISLFAQEDAYHSQLRTQLQNDFGISGGTWLISDSENTTLSSSWAPEGVTKEFIDVTGQPFTRAVRVATNDRPLNFWNYFIHFNAKNTVANGDVLLLIVSVRGLEGERGRGFINHVFGLGQAPYTSVVSQKQSPTADWQQWMIPFEVNTDLPTSWYKVHLGYQAQTIELGGIAVLNFGQTYTVDDLPHSTFHLDYEGREPDADWRVEAEARIEEHRKGDLRIRVLDGAGQPVQGAEVKMNLQRHAFGFGTAMVGPEKSAHQHKLSTDELDAYYNSFENLTGEGRSFNWAVIGDALRWATWEKPYWPPWEQSIGQGHTLNFFDWLHERKISVRGHMLVWPAFKWLPPDIEEHKNDPAYIRQRIADHIRDLVGHPRLKGQIIDWNVINEPAHLTELEDVFGGVAEYAEWFKLAAEADSNAKLYLNEYEILSAGGMNLTIQDRYKEIIQIIEANGGRIDGVGLEAHVGYPLTPPELVYEIIDEYAALGNGKEISISEYDAEGVEEFINGEYMRDFLTITFSHPAVKSFLFWGYWDKNHWLGDGPLYREDWSLKPSGKEYIDLVFSEWWTDERSQTDSLGEAAMRGFLGDYEITVTSDSTTTTEKVKLSKTDNVLEIKLDVTTNISIDQQFTKEFSLEQNYPNPFNPSTKISYSIPSVGNEYFRSVKLKVYDILGREVAELVNEQQKPGYYEVQFDASKLTSGVYFYKLQAGSFLQTKKMILLR